MSLLNDEKLNEILHNLKAVGPTEEDVVAIHEAFIGVGKIFAELKLRMDALARAYADSWQVVAARMPPDLLEDLKRLAEEKNSDAGH